MTYLFAAIGVFVILDLIRGYVKAEHKKRYLIKSVMGIVGVIVLLFLFGPFFILSPIKIGYSALHADNITLYYPRNKSDIARDTMTQLKEADTWNRDFYKTTYPMPVLLATSKLDMLRFGSYPSAGGTGNELGINIRAGMMTTQKIAHEMSHRNLALLTGKSVPAPSWFNEGLASYIGKMDDYKKPVDLQGDLREGRYAKDILDMRGVLGTFHWLRRAIWGGESRVLYGQSYLMVKYLFDTYGKERMYDFIVSLKNNGFENAFMQSFGATEEQFHQEFMNYIEHYTPNQNGTL